MAETTGEFSNFTIFEECVKIHGSSLERLQPWRLGAWGLGMETAFQCNSTHSQ
jgi:hypothetical protein